MKYSLRLLTTAEFKKQTQTESLFYKYCQTVAGTVKILLNKNGDIYETLFVDTPTLIPEDQKFSFGSQKINTLFLVGTEFQIKVWQATAQIPAGKVVTYHDIARAIGHPQAYRAVANALGKNKLVYFIPCHRVIRKNKELGGFNSGIEKKRALLASEGIQL